LGAVLGMQFGATKRWNFFDSREAHCLERGSQ
jgi:hypothetical protein